MGSLLLCGRGGRHALPLCRMRGSWSTSRPAAFQGQASDILRHAEDIMKIKKRLNEIYVHHYRQGPTTTIESHAGPRPFHDGR